MGPRPTGRGHLLAARHAEQPGTGLRLPVVNGSRATEGWRWSRGRPCPWDDLVRDDVLSRPGRARPRLRHRHRVRRLARPPVDVPAETVSDGAGAPWTSTSPTRRRRSADRQRRAVAADAAAVRGGRQGEHRTCRCTSRTATPVEVALELEAGGTGRRCGRSTTGSSRGRSTGGWSARRRSRCRPTCRSATTAAGALRRTDGHRRPDRHPGLARPARGGRPSAAPGGSPPSSTASARAQSWGVGDLADLTDLAVWSAAELGADFVLVNPLHAAEPVAPHGALAVPAHVAPVLQPALPAGRADPRVRRPAAADRGARSTALRRQRARARSTTPTSSTATPPGPPSAAALRDRARGAAQRRPRARLRRATGAARARRCDDFATWCVLAEEHGTDWRDWPAELQDAALPGGGGVRRRARRRGRLRVLAAVGARRAARSTRRPRRVGAGMALGIMHDLAVGVHPRRRRRVAAAGRRTPQGVTVGAPPDPYNQIGQDWSQPPWRPDRLGRARPTRRSAT